MSSGCRLSRAETFVYRHTDTDLVLFTDTRQYEIFRAIDGRRTVGELGPDAASCVERLWRHDLVVCDTTRSTP